MAVDHVGGDRLDGHRGQVYVQGSGQRAHPTVDQDQVVHRNVILGGHPDQKGGSDLLAGHLDGTPGHPGLAAGRRGAGRTDGGRLDWGQHNLLHTQDLTGDLLGQGHKALANFGACTRDGGHAIL